MFGSERRRDERWSEQQREQAATKKREAEHFNECHAKAQAAIQKAITDGRRFVKVSERYAGYWEIFINAVTRAANEEPKVKTLQFHTSCPVSYGHSSWEGYGLLTLDSSQPTSA